MKTLASTTYDPKAGTVTTKHCKEGHCIEFESETFNGMKQDTRVLFKGMFVCWINGEDIDKLKDDFFSLIDKYQI